MICRDCRAQDHGKCRGGTWCDCQHRVARGVMTGVAAGLASWIILAGLLLIGLGISS